MSIETGAEPPANRISGLGDEASIEKFSPRQMPVAESDAARLSALHSMAPARPVMIGGSPPPVPPVGMTWPSANSTVPNDSLASAERSGLAGFAATTARAPSMA